MSPADGERGFSLVEALVALAIIGIAAAGLIRAAENHVDMVRALELRSTAQWVAENRLVELTLDDDKRVGSGEDRVEMLGHRWQVAVATRPSADKDLRRVDVAVRADGARAPLVTLTGFVDAGTITP